MKNQTTKYMVISFIANVFLSIIKIFFGMISKSKTLLADGIHCISDMSTDVIGVIGSIISNKKPDTDHPYGHGKAEYITSIFISIFIIFLSVKIFCNSFSPVRYIDNYFILLVSIISIIIKYFVSGLLIKKGKQCESNILITSGSESRFDVLSSALAFVFILLSLLGNKFDFLKYADTIGSIIISLLTMRIGIKIFVDNFKLSLGEVELDNESINEIKNILLEYKEIKTIRRVNILKYGSYKMINIDVEMPANTTISRYYKIDQSVKKELRTIHPEYKYISIDVRPVSKKKSVK